MRLHTRSATPDSLAAGCITGRRVSRVRSRALLLTLVGVMLSSAAWAEGISGLVKDESGGILPGVTVTIQNPDTGLSRTVVTGSAGRYDAASLPLGTYTVTASLSGFTTAVRRGVTLTVGRDIVVDMVLAVGQVSDEVVVTGEAPLVETTSAAVSGLVDERAIRDLPLVSRSWDQLITLTSGATVFRPIATGSASQGFAQKFTISGQRISSNLFYQDGVELGGAQRIQGLPGSAAGVNLGVEGIREFRVLTSSYSPEYGKKAGGAIITVTKSGTNEFRGSMFEFHRNDAFDAPNFFAVRKKDPFTRNNFGGSLGGPILRNRSFFFGNYEGLRERLARPFSAIVPNAAARQGLLPAPGGQMQFVGVAPSIAPFLKLWPMPNGRDFGDGTAAFDHAPTRTAGEDYVLGRFDHHFSDSDSLFVSYTFSDAEVLSPLENPFFYELTGTREQRAAVEHSRIFSPQTMNTLRFGFHRSYHSIDAEPFVDLNIPEFTPGAGPGNLGVTGLANGGPGTQGSTFGARNSFQLSEQLSHFRGRHTFEFGGQLQRTQIDEDPTDRKNGQWDFLGLRELLLGQPLRFAGAFPPGATGVLNIGLPLQIDYEKHWRQTYAAFYVRDRFRWSQNLTLDLGLRYEVLTSPTEVNGRVSNVPVKEVHEGLYYVMDTAPVIGKKIWETDYLAGFAPRLGVAWDPFGHGKTSVRGGFGLFYDQIDTEFRFFTHTNPPFAPRAATSDRTAFPVPWDKVDVKALLPVGRTIDPNIKVPTVRHYNAAIEQQMGSAGMFRLGYVGATGSKHLVGFESNLRVPVLVGREKFWPAGAPFAQPALGQWDLLLSSGKSQYHSIQAEIQTRFAESGVLGRLRSKLAYTFSKAIDHASTLQNSSGENSRGKPLDAFDLDRDRGLAAHHVGHLFSVNFTYDLDGLPLSGVAGALLNNWQVNGIATFAAGYPVNINLGFPNSRNGYVFIVERPDLVAGGDRNPILGGHQRYFDPSQFVIPPAGFMGNLGRNTLIGPGLTTFDLSLAKRVPVSRISREFNVQLRAEIFNLFNRTNLGLPDSTVFTSSRTLRGAAGRITGTSTPARQMQLGLKVEF